MSMATPGQLKGFLEGYRRLFRPSFDHWRMQDLRLNKRIVYEVKANWKLIILNYNECLHCPVLHPCEPAHRLSRR